ncbi:MAG: N-acylneuraminate cytidylyltransferase [Bacteriovoracaceae bacterium]
MKALCIITARGGSKRIPRKNIKEFCGKPIIAYSIEAALESNLFDEVMVSTDDDEIAEISRKYGAKVPFMRSPKNSDDFSTTADVLLEVLEQYKEVGIEPESFCCIYPTAPFVTAEKLIKSFEKLNYDHVDSVLPMVKFSFPPQRGLINLDGKIKFQYPEHMSTRSQDLESIYHDAGQFYWVKTSIFSKEKKLILKSTIGFELAETEVQDIDTLDDWKIAEIKFNQLKN